MPDLKHLSSAELEAGWDHILASPKDGGVLEMIVRRPETDAREVLDIGELHEQEGLVGDNWRSRGSGMTDDGSAHPEMQLNLMNSRVVGLVAGSRDRWPLAGDQLFVDLNLSTENLPPGTRLTVGSAIIQITEVPHLGCAKFAARFGKHAAVFVNSRRGKSMNLRGVNARVVAGGTVRPGDTVSKL